MCSCSDKQSGHPHLCHTGPRRVPSGICRLEAVTTVYPAFIITGTKCAIETTGRTVLAQFRGRADMAVSLACRNSSCLRQQEQGTCSYLTDQKSKIRVRNWSGCAPKAQVSHFHSLPEQHWQGFKHIRLLGTFQTQTGPENFFIFKHTEVNLFLIKKMRARC